MRSARAHDKFEYRISKSEINTNHQKTKLKNVFENLKICILKIVSSFVLRISNFSVVGLALILFLFFAVPASAQTNPITNPSMDSDVPRNQHTVTQAVTIEVMSAIICQITGIDPIDPSLGCLTVNPETRKLGLTKPTFDANGNQQLGGMLGTTTDLIAFTYQPVVTTGAYTDYLAGNFGIVKKAYAQTGYGFEGLRPILKLWTVVRDIAYVLLTLAFIFIGIGVMLRIKIDPRTVMTIQNQIPKVIIGIILITLSYAIAAVLIDLMWVTTYAGVNLLSDHAVQNGIGTGGNETLAQKANKSIINNPLSFTNQLFETPKPGVFHITQDVSNNVGEMLRQIVKDLLGVDNGDSCFGGLGSILPGGKKLVDFSACAAGLLAFLASITLKLVILVVLMVTLFKIWFNLLKAYIYTILYVIIAPVMIVFGLLPSKPMGFENWLRRLFVNIAVFPLTAFLIVGARLLMDVYDSDKSLFVPPLVGNPNAVNFGTLLAFGALLMAPHIQTILQEKMGVKGIGSPGLIAAGLAGGAAVVGAPVGRAMKHLNRRDNRGNAQGMLSVGKEKAGEGFFNVFAKRGNKYFARKIKTRELSRDPANVYTSARDIRKMAKEQTRDKDKNIADAEKRSTDSRTNNWWRRKDSRKTRNGKRGSGGSGGGTPGKRIWFKPWKRKPGDDGPAGPSTPTGTPPKNPPGSGAEKHGGGEKDQTTTGNVTALGQVIVPGMKFGNDKKSMLGQMYKNFRDKDKPATQAASGQKLDHILTDFGHQLEHLAQPENIGKVNDVHISAVFKELEERYKDKPNT